MKHEQPASPQDEMSGLDHRDPASLVPVPADKSEKNDLWQKLGLAIVPALVAVVGTVWVTQRNNDTNQSTELAKLKGRILDDTSLVSNDLRKVRKLLVNQGYDAALPAKVRYAVGRDRWYNEQLKFRERVQSAYGEPTADLILNRSSNNFVVDRCYVLVARDSKARSGNCAARLRNEVAVLTARQDAANVGRDYPLAGAEVVVPSDFTTSLTVANSLLERVVDCKKTVRATHGTVPSAAGPRCSDLKYLQYALNLRVNLVGVVQQTLEDAVAKRR